LAYTIKHKEVEDNFIPKKKWAKEKPKLLRSLPYSKLQTSPIELLNEKEVRLTELYKKVNADIRNGDNPDIILKNDKQGNLIWRVRPLKKSTDPNKSLFAGVQKRSIVNVMRFVDDKTKYSRALESILPRSIKEHHNHFSLLSASVLGNALRMGTRGIAAVCDLDGSALLSAENECLRMETLTEAVHTINIEISKLPIYREYNINGIHHASLDGMKLGTRISNIAARHSPKFLGRDAGVSAYNIIFNFLSLAGQLISSNDYEGHFVFEMLHQQTTEAFKLECASTDRHGTNSFNFGLFDLSDRLFAPRIPKIHNQTLWGFGKHSDYDGLIISPHRMVNTNYIVDDWDNMRRMMVSMLTGVAIPNIVIGKVALGRFEWVNINFFLVKMPLEFSILNIPRHGSHKLFFESP